MFGDWSQDVSCSVGFLRGRLISSLKTEISFVFGKARVAPMRALSIPMIELQADLLTTRLKIENVKAFTVKVKKIFMWINSTIVLQWLSSNDMFPICVGNRVEEILESAAIGEMHHVQGGNNPAETCTRVIYSETLKNNSWVIGPSILRAKVWPFKSNQEVIKKVWLWVPSCDVDNCLETSSTFVTNVGPSNFWILGLIGKRSAVLLQNLKKNNPFLLRMLPSHA